MYKAAAAALSRKSVDTCGLGKCPISVFRTRRCTLNMASRCHSSAPLPYSAASLSATPTYASRTSEHRVRCNNDLRALISLCASLPVSFLCHFESPLHPPPKDHRKIADQRLTLHPPRRTLPPGRVHSCVLDDGLRHWSEHAEDSTPHAAQGQLARLSRSGS